MLHTDSATAVVTLRLLVGTVRGLIGTVLHVVGTHALCGMAALRRPKLSEVARSKPGVSKPGLSTPVSIQPPARKPGLSFDCSTACEFTEAPTWDGRRALCDIKEADCTRHSAVRTHQ